MSKKLVTSGLMVSGMTLLSRLLGMVRDAVIANVIGASAAADLFLFANRIPNFLRRLFAEGAFSQAFVPVLTEYQQRGDLNATRCFIRRVSGTLGGLVLMVTLLGVLLSPLLTLLFGFGWFVDWLQGGPDGYKFPLAALLLRITFPYLWFITLVAFSGAVLNTLGQFSVMAFSPVLLNISMIGCALWLAPHLAYPEIGLACGVFLGGVLQLLLQLPFLKQAGVLAWPCWSWKDEGVVKIRRLMLPALFGVSVNQINLLFDSAIASFMMTGAISWLYYADRLLEFPIGLLGAALSTILLPTLARYYAQQDSDQFARCLEWGVRMVCLLGIPAMLGLIVLAQPIVMVLYLRGEFTLYDLQATAVAVQAFTLGLFSLLLVKVLAPGYYARQDVKTPVRYGAIAMVSNMGFNVLALKLSYIGLALASSLSSSLNAGLLLYGLIRRGVYAPSWSSACFVLRIILASSVMTGIIVYLNPEDSQWLAASLTLRMYWLIGLVAVAVVLYGVLLTLLGVRWQHLHSQLL